MSNNILLPPVEFVNIIQSLFLLTSRNNHSNHTTVNVDLNANNNNNNNNNPENPPIPIKIGQFGNKSHFFGATLIMSIQDQLRFTTPLDVFKYFAKYAERYSFRNLIDHAISPAVYVSNSFLSAFDQIKFGLKNMNAQVYIVIFMHPSQEKHQLTLRYSVIIANEDEESAHVKATTGMNNSDYQPLESQIADIITKTSSMLQHSIAEVLKHLERDLLWDKLIKISIDPENFSKLQELIVKTPLQKYDPSLESFTNLTNVKWLQAQNQLSLHTNFTRSIFVDKGQTTTHHLFVFHPKNHDFAIQLSYDDNMQGKLSIYFCSREFRTIGPEESELINIVVNHLLFYIWKNLKV